MAGSSSTAAAIVPISMSRSLATAIFPVIPFRASEEDIDTVARSLTAIPNAFAWPAAWPTNAFAINAAQYLLDGLAKAFPQRIIHPPIPFVNSISDLLTANLGTPSTAVRQTARKAFATLQEHFELHVPGSDAPEALSA